MRVLGIETSCDETAAAIYDGEGGLLAHRLFSQIDLHAKYGVWSPSWRPGNHVRKLVPLIEEVLVAASLSPPISMAWPTHPDPAWWAPCWSAQRSAEALAYGWGVPALGVHHLRGHLLAPMLEADPPAFPFFGAARVGRAHIAR